MMQMSTRTLNAISDVNLSHARISSSKKKKSNHLRSASARELVLKSHLIAMNNNHADKNTL